ncbi:MAG: FAD-dependent oxidoreductase [Ignavibacteriae bacterium]|nr:FAD-dependent oxidoreductase [Ignavibacteriota bacterium]
MPVKKLRIVVVGGLAAGPSAAAKSVRTNPNAEVTMFEASETISYGICETPYVISGVIQDERKLLVYTPQRLQEEKGIQVKILHRVEKIQPTKKTVTVRDIKNQTVQQYEYDRLILATGARTKRLNIKGEDARNVFHLHTREDTLAIMNYLKMEKPKSAVIIGGGYVGMEMSEALRMKGLDVTVVHRHRLPMSSLEQETSERILQELEKNQVQFVSNAKIEGFQVTKESKVKFVFTNRGSYEADIVIVAIGVEPNAELAKTAKIRTGKLGGIITDERQQTNVDGIYAAGDCCEVKNIVSGKTMYVPLATVASRAAWVAGENAAGGRAIFKGAIRAMAVKIFDLKVATVGLHSDEAKEAGFQVVKETVTTNSRVAAMPGNSKIMVTLIIDRRTKRLLGANVTGCEGAAMRANTLGVAIQHKMTLDDISRFDLIYAPPFAPLWDPILVAANQAKKKLS